MTLIKKNIPIKPWQVLLLSLSAVLVVPALGFITSINRKILDPASVNPSRSILEEAGFASFLFSLIISIYVIVKGIKALKQGNKSWPVWLGVILAVLILLFWIFMVISELIFVH